MIEDTTSVRLEALHLATKLSPEGQTANQLICDAAKIEAYLLNEEDKKNVD